MSAKWACFAVSILFFFLFLAWGSGGDIRGTGIAMYWMLVAIFLSIAKGQQR